MIYDKNLLSKGSVTLDDLLQDLVSLPFGFRLARRKLVLLIDWSPLLSPGGKPYWIPPLPRGAVGIVVCPVWPSSRTVSPLPSAPRSTPVGTHSGGAPALCLSFQPPRSWKVGAREASPSGRERGARAGFPREYLCGRRGGARPAPARPSG